MYDFERGAKTTGAKFYFNTEKTAIAEWRLINDALAYYTMRGYELVIPPFLVNRKTATMAGILPRFDGDYYDVTQPREQPKFLDRLKAVFNPYKEQAARDNDLLLIPTAETPMVGMHQDEIFDEDQLPRRYCAITPCFRREAGAGGKRDAGMKRVHQFFKVELFVICKPEFAEEEHQRLLRTIQAYLAWLRNGDDDNQPMIPGAEFRVVELPENDRAPVATKTYDIELKIDGEWVEVASISNTGTNQTQPAQVRYRPAPVPGETKRAKPIKCVMLNGTGLALPRIMLAITRAWEGKVEDAEPPITQKPALKAVTVVPPDAGLDLTQLYCFDEFMGDDQPGNRVIKTGEQIIEEYYPYWREQMVANFGPDDERITFQNCIDDYCVVNWAWKIDGNGNKIQ